MYIQIIDTCMYTYRIIADHTICVCHIACIIYHISYLIRHLSYVTYHMWHIICDISYVVCCTSYVIYHISYVIYHISSVIYAIYHISHIISNISYIISYLSYKLYIYIHMYTNIKLWSTIQHDKVRHPFFHPEPFTKGFPTTMSTPSSNARNCSWGF